MSLERILPGIRDGSMTNAEAARLLGISRRSLRRYAERLKQTKRQSRDSKRTRATAMGPTTAGAEPVESARCYNGLRCALPRLVKA